MWPVVPALDCGNPPEIARVELSTRTELTGGFGGPGRGFFIVVAVVALR